MHLPQDESRTLTHYEGLVAKTAYLLVDDVEFGELEDVKQMLAIKVLQALRSYDPAKRTNARGGPHRNGHYCRCPQCRYVFQCVFNLTKDLKQRKKRGERFIEDLVCSPFADGDGASRLPSRDNFEARHLAADHDAVYGEIETDGFELPNTLVAGERAVVIHLYAGYKMTEIMRILQIGRNEYDARMGSIETKLADWRPGAARQHEWA